MSDKSHIDYCNMGHLPIYFGFCDNKKAWRKEMRRMKIDDADQMLLNNKPATCWSFTRPNGYECIIVCIDKKSYKTQPVIAVIGLITHECSHAIDYIMQAIGERNPSTEFKAYTLQGLVQFCIDRIGVIDEQRAG